MAIGVSTCIIRADGATTNGGGFVTGSSGTDYSNQASAQYALTGLTSAGAGNTLLSGSASADMVGNWACATSGTNVNQGFYSVDSVVVGVSITFSTRKDGTSIASGVSANGIVNIGGAFKLGATSASRTDDDFFEAAPNTGGNIYYIKGTHTTGGPISLSATGTTTLKNSIIGYNSSLGDAPSIASGNQPTIACGINAFTLGTHWELSNCTFTTTSATGITMGAISKISFCKITNSSGTANRTGLGLGNSSVTVLGCDLSSTAGYAIAMPNSNGHIIIGNRIHSSVSGIRPSAAFSGQLSIFKNIISGCSTAGIDLSAGAFTGHALIISNTLYGASTPAGSGISFAASSGGINLISNIISNWTTGINGAGSITVQYSLNNNFFGNTTARTNWSAGTGDIAVDPAFVNPATGNFATGINVQRLGFFGTSFPAGTTATYDDIGAAQADQAGFFTDVTGANVITTFGAYKYNSSSNNRTPTVVQPATGDVRSGTTYGPSSSLTGTLVATPPPVRKTSDATSKMVQKTSAAS